MRVVAVRLALIFCLAGAALAEEEEAKLLLYSWPDFIPQSVLDDFTEETGIGVEFSAFASNEIMYAKLKLLKGRGYDVIVPATYMVTRLRDEGLIRFIDHTRLENFKHLNRALLNKAYDPDNAFSIPYLWGSAGIAINTEKVEQTSITSWQDLWHPQWRGRLALVNDMRAVFHMALKINGRSTNATDPDEINLAYRQLRRLMVNVESISDEPHAALLDGGSDLGVAWNGDVFVAQQQNPAIQYIYPKEGASFWVDSFAIPARASNLENAYRFIDYMLLPEVAARCVQELGYATANRAALELLDESIRSNPIIFPSRTLLSRAEFDEDIGTAKRLIELYWGLLKSMQ